MSSALLIVVLGVGFPATQYFGLTWQIVLATLGGCGFAGYGYRKGSLSPSGQTLESDSWCNFCHRSASGLLLIFVKHDDTLHAKMSATCDLMS